MYSRNLAHKNYYVPEHYSGTAFRKVEDRIYIPPVSEKKSTIQAPPISCSPIAMSETASKNLYIADNTKDDISFESETGNYEFYDTEDIPKAEGESLISSEQEENQDSIDTQNTKEKENGEQPIETVAAVPKSSLLSQIETDDLLIFAIILMLLDKEKNTDCQTKSDGGSDELVLIMLLILFMR